MNDPILFRRTDTLAADDARYWKDLLYRTAKIGTEIEVAPPRGVPRPDFEARVQALLEPSGSFERLGRFGVLDVAPEHSGVEVRVIGRQPFFAALHRQYAAILRILHEEGGRPRATCGLHFHLLTPGLAEPVPEIVLANLWNLVRRYAPELKFMTSAGERREALCRRRTPNDHRELVRHTPGVMRMAEIQHALKVSRLVPQHQNFFNLEHSRFDDDGNVFPLHIEFRFPDADLCPLSVTAKTCLFLALLLKAVDLSQHGVIHVGKIEPWRRKVALLDWLSNDSGDLATSDTRRVTDAVLDELRAGARELLDLLQPAFDHCQAPEAREVLGALAEMPVSLWRCAGRDWPDLEAAYRQALAPRDERAPDEVDRCLARHIDLGDWSGCADAAAWERQAARELFVGPPELAQRLARLQALRGLRWDARQGTLVFTG
jgi:hypothetical protein